LKRRRFYRILALILCENGRFRSVDLLYWIAVLFWGWRVILLQGDPPRELSRLPPSACAAGHPICRRRRWLRRPPAQASARSGVSIHLWRRDVVHVSQVNGSHSKSQIADSHAFWIGKNTVNSTTDTPSRLPMHLS
jgi:hypothetical protein